jgi:hypothetical protein
MTPQDLHLDLVDRHSSLGVAEVGYLGYVARYKRLTLLYQYTPNHEQQVNRTET